MLYSELEKNEQRLIVLLCRKTFSESDITSINEILQKPINWSQVFYYSVYNKISTLIWYNLKKLDIRYTIPKYLKSILNFTELGVEEQNKIYIKEVNNILLEMKINGVVCNPVKGAFFIPNIYKNYKIRYMGDIDLLVKKENIGKVHMVMKELGYVQGQYVTSQNSIIPLDRATEIKWKLKMSHLYPFVKKIDSKYLPAIKCDFRFSLDDTLNPEPINEMVDMSGNEVLKPYHAFVHLCTHLYDEGSKAVYTTLGKDHNLIKFCDIREFVIQYMKDEYFDEVIEFAYKYDLKKSIYYTLHYLSVIYNDGYEKNLMNRLNIADTSFLESFGDTTLQNTSAWKKDFWKRVFSGYNEDELEQVPSFYKV